MSKVAPASRLRSRRRDVRATALKKRWGWILAVSFFEKLLQD